jgi:hypothetical protein
MTKKLENMTQDERIAYWDKQRANEKKQRKQLADQVPASLLALVKELESVAQDMARQGLYEGGPRYIYCDTFHELERKADSVRREFCLDD